jgi:hypothetical protein
LTGWYNADVLGIDLGITMLMTENARSGFVWDIFIKNTRMRGLRWRKLDSNLLECIRSSSSQSSVLSWREEIALSFSFILGFIFGGL